MGRSSFLSLRWAPLHAQGACAARRCEAKHIRPPDAVPGLGRWVQ